jgi:UDP-N-acetylmuramoylalanine--D-glutamate ligase
VKTEQVAQQVHLEGKRATVLGLAREGTALAHFLVHQGAMVTVTDLKSDDALQSALESLAGLPVRYYLGGHPLEVLDCDVMFVSPGVPLDAPILLEARRRRLPLSSESRLFCRLCPAPVVGITGSSGKTTTSTLVAKMIEGSGRRVHLGGNIGSPLIDRLAAIGPMDAVVAELSSFQLDFFGPVLDANPYGDLVSPLFPPHGWSPPVAAVLNVTPNHLDRHPTMDDYIMAKLKILRYQSPQDVAVLGWDDAVARSFADHCRGQVAFFSVREPVARGAYLKDGSLVLRRAAGEETVCSVGDIRLRGMHNVANVLAACAISDVLGVEPRSMAAVATTFTGVEHRLELVRQWRGASYYNDSIATSPERAIAALKSFDEPIVLLAGGRDKHLPWDDWAEWVHRKVSHVILFGEAAGLIERVLIKRGLGAINVKKVGTLREAVMLARQVARSGDVVLFSPGGTSFDAFHDYAQRGQVFRHLVQRFSDEKSDRMVDHGRGINES